MATNLGDLNVSLTADVTKYKASLTEAERLTRSFSNQLKGTFNDAAGAVKGFIGAWAGMQAVTGVLHKLNEVGDLSDVAAGLNVTAESLQKLEYAGVSAGVSVEAFHGLLQKVSSASAKFAEGDEDIVAAFKKIGIASVDLNAPDKVLLQIADHLNNIPNAADRMKTAIELGGRGGAQALLRLAATGREELESTMDELAKKGLLIGNNVVDGADKAGDAIATLAYEFNQKLKLAVVDNVDTITKLGDAFYTIMPAALSFVEKLASGFVWLGQNIGIAAAKLSGFETGEDKLKRLQATLPELARQEDALYKKYSTDRSVQRSNPSMEAQRTWEQLQGVRQRKSATEGDISNLYGMFAPAAAAPTPPKPKEGTPPAITGAGSPKAKGGSDKKANFESEEEKIAKGVASLLEKSDAARLSVIQKQTTELERQRDVWANLDTATLSEDQNNARTEALQMYSDALGEVAAQTQQIYDERNKDFADSTKEWADWAEKQRAMAKSIEETVDPTIKLKREIEEIKKLTEDGFLPTDQAEAYIKLIQDRTKETTDYVKDLGMTFQSAFQSAVLEGKGFQEVLQGVVKDIAAMILKMAVINPLMEKLFGGKSANGTSSEGWIGAVIKGIGKAFGGSTVKSANGNVFTGPIHPFANGGIVNSPTLFPMDGGTGLTGEAGPEGILPLKRIGGRLGVSAQGVGGNTTVNNITVNVEGGKDPQATGDIVAEKVMRAIAKQEISAATRVGGTLNPMSVGA